MQSCTTEIRRRPPTNAAPGGFESDDAHAGAGRQRLDVEAVGGLPIIEENRDIGVGGGRQPVQQFVGDAADAVVAVVQHPAVDA
jgi:hypothetical protein